MKKRPKTPVTEEQIEHIFDVLDEALRGAGLLLAETEEDILRSEPEIDFDIELPEHLRDIDSTLEYGRKVLHEGFSYRPVHNAQPETAAALAQAARNGKAIPEEILEKMQKDRDTAERDAEKS